MLCRLLFNGIVFSVKWIWENESLACLSFLDQTISYKTKPVLKLVWHYLLFLCYYNSVKTTFIVSVCTLTILRALKKGTTIKIQLPSLIQTCRQRLLTSYTHTHTHTNSTSSTLTQYLLIFLILPSIHTSVPFFGNKNYTHIAPPFSLDQGQAWRPLTGERGRWQWYLLVWYENIVSKVIFMLPQSEFLWVFTQSNYRNEGNDRSGKQQSVTPEWTLR